MTGGRASLLVGGEACRVRGAACGARGGVASSAVMLRGWLGALVLVGCERAEPTLPPRSGPAVPEPVPAVSEPVGRACGEAGATATELPSRVAAGRTAVGSGTLRPGGSLQIGTVALRYDESTWIGTHRAGERGPGLSVEIDRSEVGPHAPWGTLEALRPDMTGTVVVGPYHVALRSGSGTPPAELAISVTRELCPATAVIEPAATPRWFWLSSEGLRAHTYDPQREMLGVAIQGRGSEPRVDVTHRGYRHWFEPRPGVMHTLRAGRYVVSFDRVEAGPETRFVGRWLAEGEARVHVRGRVEAAERVTFPEAVASAGGCGDPSPARTELPRQLSAAVKIGATRRLRPGERAQLGPVALEFGALEVPARGQGPYREEGYSLPNLQIVGPRGGTSLTGPYREPRLYRIERALLRVTGEGEGVRVEEVSLGCEGQLAAEKPTGPVYVWLSSRGRTWVRFGGADVQALNLQIFLEAGPGSLGLGSERGSLVREIDGELVGLGFTLDAFLVEVVDVQRGAAGPDGLPPASHVQLRVTPG